MRILGIVLIVLGVLALVFGAIRYTTREEVVDVGPIEASVERERSLPIPPIAGIVAVGAGVVLLLVGARQKS